MAAMHRRKRIWTAQGAGPEGASPAMGRAIRRIVPALLFTLVAACTGRVPMPKIPAAKGAHCVRPTQWMIKNHMKLLMQLRYEAVHEGIRHKAESLPGCINCHVSRLPDGKYPSVTSRKFFCNACHEYVGVRIDCFECHTNRPQTDGAVVAETGREWVLAAGAWRHRAAVSGRKADAASTVSAAQGRRWRSPYRRSHER